ncbi:hypothetical protein Tco_1430572 [Tanacetum coccineum]
MAMLPTRTGEILKNTKGSFCEWYETIGFDNPGGVLQFATKGDTFKGVQGLQGEPRKKEYGDKRRRCALRQQLLMLRRLVDGFWKFMPHKPDLSFSGLEEFMNKPIVSEHTVKKPVVETNEAKACADKSKVVRKNFGPPLIEDWISDSEDEAESKPKIEKKTVKPSFAKIGESTARLPEKGVIDSGCSRYMTGNVSYLTNFEEINRGYVAFGGTKACDDAGKARMETVPGDVEKKVTEELGKQGGDPSKEGERDYQEKDDNVNSTKNINAADTNEVNIVGGKTSIKLPDDPNMPSLEDIVYLNDELRCLADA